MTNKGLEKGSTLKSGTYNYRIVKMLGNGGFGITYLATMNVKVGNLNIEGKVAIKEHFISEMCERDTETSNVIYSNPVKDRIEGSRKDFISEAQRLQKMGVEHPNIVKVNEIFEANNTAYYVMEYLEDESLRSYVSKKGKLSEAETRSIIAPIVEAVAALHANDMTHLDIKPDNIMLVKTDDGILRPVLIDFGLSKHYSKNGTPTSTINTLGCSDGYSPSEQYIGITSFSPEADVYALGATVYYCLTGKSPKNASELRDGELANELEGVASEEMVEAIRRGTRMSKFDREKDVRKLLSIERIDETQEEDGKQLTENHEAVRKNKGEDDNETRVINGGEKPTDNISQHSDRRKKKLLTKVGIAAGVIGILFVGVLCMIKSNVTAEDVEKAYDSGDYEKCMELAMQIPDDAVAQKVLGSLYYHGYGVKEDYNEAVKWYRMSAEQGYAEAQYNLGVMYNNGYGVKEDYNEAVKWYKKAAEQGFALAQNNLGLMYNDGQGVNQDHNEAMKWYMKAAEQGNAEAQTNLGVMYYDGQGVNQDYNEALKWYMKAVEQGYAVAQNNLGLMYDNGYGVKRDYNEAVKWYRMAAEQGFAAAQYNLGVMYCDGEGVKQDYNEAMKWFRMAAEQGFAQAQYNLGVMYYNGQGVKQDYNEAIKWWRMAAEQGNAAAQEALDRFGK
ncbi:MAG: SEL1-like repeat protein [Paramuribaculum sp.]|nr:SEL1-like repeat protein [Paramuribaculum sp.]